MVTLLVLDSVGIGALPDAAEFGDEGSDTLGHLAAHVGGLHVPHLQSLGLGNIARPTPIPGVPSVERALGSWGKLASVSRGKDTATGHWEMMGLVLDEPLQTYPDGFPPEMVERMLSLFNVSGILGNRADSGTAIIEALGADHLRTGWPIVYTSADPVLQIAAHEECVPIDALYAWCEAVYPLAVEAGLGRVIARPFVGKPGAFQRTHRRKDYALEPPEPTMLDEWTAAGLSTVGIGKIGSIYAHRGVQEERPTRDNEHGIRETLDAMRARAHDLVFTNLVDFDMLYGHRRDPEGYAACLQAFDLALPEILAALEPSDLLVITADHGNDPTFSGTDHTREYVPWLVVGPGFSPGRDLGVGRTFADVGATVLAHLGVSTARPWGTPAQGLHASS